MHANEPEMAKKWEKEEALREKIRGIIKRELEATTTSVIPPKDTPTAFKKSTQTAIDIDDEDDEKIESIDESGILYKAGVKKYGKEGMAKILSAAGKKKSHAEIGAIKDKYEKDKKESVNEGRLNSKIKKAILIAIEMSGNMTGAVKKIERIKKGLSNDKKVKDALRLANESINEASNSVPRHILKQLGSELNKTTDMIVKVTDKYKNQGDIGGMVKIWMRGLHLRLKKGGIKIESINESTKEWGKTLDKIAKDRHLKSISKKDRDTLMKIAKLMKRANESVNESDLGLTYKKGKTVKVTHKKSGKELVIIDKPNVKREYEKIGYFAEGIVNESPMAPFSSSEAKQHINQDIKKMSKHLGKASQQSIKIMMDGVRGGKYTAMDISRGIKEGPAGRAHFGELGFLQQLWNKVRDGFRRYTKDRKLS